MYSIALLGGRGYIGTALTGVLARAGYQIHVYDTAACSPAHLSGANVRHFVGDYRSLAAQELSSYQVVVLLAAHSSVAVACADPFGAWRNNVEGFVHLISQLRGQRLIYASSSSVYTGVGAALADESAVTTEFQNIYDFSKFCDDQCARLLYPRAVGLRFGSVCGWSPVMRNDIMINCMVNTALQTGQVRIANASVSRPILGLSDLCRALSVIIEREDLYGPFNLSSFTSTVGEIGAEVARLTKAQTFIAPPCDTYDFSMSSERFRRMTGFSFEDDITSIVNSLLQHRLKSQKTQALPAIPSGVV
ncbi:NAD-dependent epimerase/dehydratase [Caballeronia calidae]|uniref:NAD-dependent epimerase/dehydratase n=1 Tax=Caballeronia calidae TaxID=1777139 RepID=A0A158EK12_9BURK|nr:NAD(P)-dependent oxidoreductase [Caballeronia calidae]SAL07144.1 NAD-dependent epimerase/dehydratase [Caballeronia calidae]